MSFLSRIFSRRDPVKRDAETIYTRLMEQSRLPVFFGEGRFPDNYDGRIDVLTLHMAFVLETLRRFDSNGAHLSQALFDYMKDDFEIALREQGLSDTGVKKRIKPMISLFYTRVKAYSEGFENNTFSNVASAFHASKPYDNESAKSLTLFDSEFCRTLDQYVTESREEFSSYSLGEIALGKFIFPSL